MRVYRSQLGIILAVLYFLIAAVVTYRVYGCVRQGFLPCDFPLVAVILPAVPILELLHYVGVRYPSLSDPGPYPRDVTLILLCFMFCVVLIYFLGAGLELGYRFVIKRLFKKPRTI